MVQEYNPSTSPKSGIAKAPTGITGLDQVLGGGLPCGRPTIVTGVAGCGKTLLSMEFLVRGAREFGEPGVFMSFEETSNELIENMESLGFGIAQLEAEHKLALDFVRVERSEIEETGEYDLEALFIRLGYAIDSIGAKRVVLDTIEALFAGLHNHMILRAELRRLFRWLKGKGVTTIVTAERGDGTLTRHGLEEYVSDCVILLDHRVTEQLATRRLRVVKYRGSYHGTNEYPFLITQTGISLLPITALELQHTASNERIPTGIPRLDTMLGGQGYFRGSSILVTGTAGAGKSSVAAHLVRAAAERGERSLYVALEESERQIVRNMHSIGLDLDPYIEQGLLRFHTARPTVYGLEMHLVKIHSLIEEYQPQVVIIDPISNLTTVGDIHEVKIALMRLVDYLKTKQITALFTNLTGNTDLLEQTDIGVSSLMDTWILLKMVESNGERNRTLALLKSRGMEHSNQVREFNLTSGGIQLIDVHTGADAVLTGTARIAYEAAERAALAARRHELERKQRALAHKREALEATIRMQRAQLELEEEEMQIFVAEMAKTELREQADAKQLARQRRSDAYGDQQEVSSAVDHKETNDNGSR